MIGAPESSRGRRWIACAVVLAHALLLWVALLARSRLADQQVVSPQQIVMALDLTRNRPMDALPARPQLAQPELQRFAPQLEQRVVQLPEIEVPEPVVPDSAPAPAAAPAAPPTDSGLAGAATVSTGAAGGGNGLVLLQRVLPEYPAAAARKGEQGITGVVLHILESGRVDDVKVERSSGSGDLDRAAVQAIRHWRFQRLPAGSAPQGRWIRTDQRFVLYKFMYSRLAAGSVENVYAEQLKPRSGKDDEATPGSQQALQYFIAAMRDGSFTGADAMTPKQLAEMRGVLDEWGAVQFVQFTGIAGGSRWMKHEVRQQLAGHLRREVEVSWNMFEVRHDHAVSEWLIGIDHDANIWAAEAGRWPGM